MNDLAVCIFRTLIECNEKNTYQINRIFCAVVEGCNTFNDYFAIFLKSSTITVDFRRISNKFYYICPIPLYSTFITKLIVFIDFIFHFFTNSIENFLPFYNEILSITRTNYYHTLIKTLNTDYINDTRLFKRVKPIVKHDLN